jgi:hypothetical protein
LKRGGIVTAAERGGRGINDVYFEKMYSDNNDDKK